MGRPRKNPAAAAEPVDDTAEFQRKIDSMQRAILELAAQNEALKVAARSGTGDAVMLENTGLVQIVIPIPNGRDVVLDVKGPRKVGSVPAAIVAMLERETDFFSKGKIRRIGEVTTNKNVIQDPQKWVDDVAEKDLKRKIAEIDSEGSLNVLWHYIDTIEEPTGKHLLLRRTIAAKMSEKFGYELVEDETEA